MSKQSANKRPAPSIALAIKQLEEAVQTLCAIGDFATAEDVCRSIRFLEADLAGQNIREQLT